MKNFLKKLGVALLGAAFTVVALVLIYLGAGVVAFLLNLLRSGIKALATFLGGNLFMTIVAIIILCVGLTVFYMFCHVPFKGWVDSKLAERRARKEEEEREDEEEEPARVIDELDRRGSRRESQRRMYTTAGKL